MLSSIGAPRLKKKAPATKLLATFRGQTKHLCRAVRDFHESCFCGTTRARSLARNEQRSERQPVLSDVRLAKRARRDPGDIYPCEMQTSVCIHVRWAIMTQSCLAFPDRCPHEQVHVLPLPSLCTSRSVRSLRDKYAP